jgi:hypothetical protein
VSYRDELDAWRRTREATKRIMAELGRDPDGRKKKDADKDD